MWVVAWAVTWGTFATGLVWVSTTSRRFDVDTALMIRVILYLLLMAGVIFMMPALGQLSDWLA